MSKKYTRETVLHTCPHRLDLKHVIANVILLDDCIEIRCHEQRTREKWSRKMSFSHVSGMVQRYQNDLAELWELLVQSMQMFGETLQFSTQHIIYFTVTNSSVGRSAMCIYEVSNFNLNMIFIISVS